MKHRINPYGAIFALAVTLFLFGAVGSSYNSGPDYAQVDQIQGLYVFVKAKPTSQYDYLGTVKGTTVGKHEFDILLESMIKRTKSQYPEANAIIFDGSIRQTHNTKVSAVRLK